MVVLTPNEFRLTDSITIHVMKYEVVSHFNTCPCFCCFGCFAACPSKHFEESHLIVNEDGSYFCVFSADKAREWYAEKGYSYDATVDAVCPEDHSQWREYQGVKIRTECGGCCKFYDHAGDIRIPMSANRTGCKSLRYRRK
jgi:hypothetical protein